MSETLKKSHSKRHHRHHHHHKNKPTDLSKSSSGTSHSKKTKHRKHHKSDDKKEKRKHKRKDRRKHKERKARQKLVGNWERVQHTKRKMGVKDLRALVWKKLEMEGKAQALRDEMFLGVVLENMNSAIGNYKIQAEKVRQMRKSAIKASIRQRVLLASAEMKERREKRLAEMAEAVDQGESESSDSLDVVEVGLGSSENSSTDDSFEDSDLSESSDDVRVESEVVDMHPVKFTSNGISLTELDKNAPHTGSLNFKLKSNTVPPVTSLFDQVKGRRKSLKSNSGLRHSDTPSTSTLVMDCGSTSIKCGVSGEDFPRYLIPSVLAKRKDDEDSFVGGLEAMKLVKTNGPVELEDFDQFQNYSDFQFSNPLDPNNPNWDDTTLMWEYLFSEVYQVDPEDHNLMMIETPDMSWTGRAETMEIMFEVFNVPKLKISNSGLMSLYGFGQLNGLVVDLGRRLQIIPVIDGMVESHHAYNLTRGISESEEYFSRLLKLAGYNVDTNNYRDYQIVKELKENCCYVAQDYDTEIARPKDELKQIYNASNGKEYTLGEERFQCTEPLFNPNLQGQLEKEHRLQSLVFKAIRKCPIDSRKNLFSNILLVGGGSCYTGLAERLKKEVQTLADSKIRSSVKVKVIANDNRKYLPWMGASLFSNFSNFEDYAIWSEDYHERGAEKIAQETMYT